MPEDLYKLGDVVLHVEEEDYTYDSDVTENPMEDGSVISDNMHSKPIVGKLTGICKNDDGSYPQQQLDTLRRYMNEPVIIDYFGVQTLQNCVLQNMENVHNCSTGGGFVKSTA